MKVPKLKNVLSLIFIVLGVGSILPGIVATCYLLTKGASADDLIKSDIVSITSLIVTVWAGLNISNYFDKKEYESFEETIKASLNEKEQAYVEVSEKLDQKNDALLILKESMETNMLENLLSAFLLSRDDLMSLFFYEQFRCEKNIYSALLISIENYFAQVYMLYSGKRNKELLPIVYRGLNRIKELKSQMLDSDEFTDRLTRAYLVFRKAEFMFYGSKSTENKEERIQWLHEALENYNLSCKVLGFYIAEYENDGSSTKYEGQHKDRKYAAYFSNTIGELHQALYIESKKEDEQEYKTALFYYSCSTSWIKDTEYKREVYYRNYGILLEKQDDLNSFLAAKEQYKEAMKTNDLSWNLLHSIISISDKIVNVIIGIPSAKPDQARGELLSSDSFNTKLNQLSQEEKRTVMEELGELFDNASIMCRLYSDNYDGYLYLAVHFRDLFLLTQSSEYLERANAEIKIALALKPQHPLVKIVDRDIVDLWAKAFDISPRRSTFSKT